MNYIFIKHKMRNIVEIKYGKDKYNCIIME